jgi:hypothetical protein
VTVFAKLSTKSLIDGLWPVPYTDRDGKVTNGVASVTRSRPGTRGDSEVSPDVAGRRMAVESYRVRWPFSILKVT